MDTPNKASDAKDITPEKDTINEATKDIDATEEPTSQIDELTSLEMGEDSHPENTSDTPKTDDVATTAEETQDIPPTDNKLADTPTTVAPAPATDAKPKKKKTGLIIGIIIGLVVLLGGGAAAYKFLVIDNQPQNFMDRATQTTMANKKPLKITQNITAGKQDGATSQQTVKGEMLFVPTSQLGKLQFGIDHPMIGSSKIELMMDGAKQNFYLKLNLDKKILSMVNALLPSSQQLGQTAFFTGFINQLYQKVNNQWFMLSEGDFKEAVDSAKTDKVKSMPELKDLMSKCHNEKNLSLLKFIEVKQELDRKDNQRRFEVAFSKSMLEDSLNKHSDNQCFQEVKKLLDKSETKNPDGVKTIMSVDPKTMLISGMQITQNNYTADMNIEYGVSDKIELPTNTKNLNDLKTMIMQSQQDLMRSLFSPINNLKTPSLTLPKALQDLSDD
jgi:hypothetical protein